MLISRENITSQQNHKISWFVKMKVVFTRHNLKSILTWKDNLKTFSHFIDGWKCTIYGNDFFQHVCVANKKKQGCAYLGIPECFIFVI